MIASNHKENVWLEPGLNEEWETHGLKLMKGWERPGRLRRESERFAQKEALGWGLKMVRITQADRSSKEGLQPGMMDSKTTG